LHPSFGARAEFRGIAPRAQAADFGRDWSELDEDDQSDRERRLCVAVIRALIQDRPSTFVVDLIDDDVRRELVEAAAAVGAAIQDEGNNRLSGSLVTGLVDALVTETYSTLAVSVDGQLRFEVWDYPDTARALLSKDELAAIMSPLAAQGILL
jgi:hypothetical protein